MGLDFDVTYKHSSKVNIWGAINGRGRNALHIFRENMDATKYISILKNDFLKIYDDMYYIQFDNDSKHTAKKTVTFLDKNNIKCIKFPAYSPDLNPIENIWSILKHNLLPRKSEINTTTFGQIILEEWNKIDQQIIKNCIDSMSKRLQTIIKNKGGYIDY